MGGYELYFCENSVLDGEYPFLSVNASGKVKPMEPTLWDSVKSWTKLVNSFHIPEQGVLCWVSDTNKSPKASLVNSFPALIVGEKGDKYLSYLNDEWAYAKPLDKQDLQNLIY